MPCNVLLYKNFAYDIIFTLLFFSPSSFFLSMLLHACSKTSGDHILGGRLRSLPTVLVNFRFPWGVLILYYEVPEKLRPYMLQQEIATNGNSSTLTRQELVLAKWLHGDEEYKNDRLKLISYVAEGPWVVRNMVTGRPALIGKKLPVTYSLDKGGGSKSRGSSSSSSSSSSSTSRHQNGGTVVERQPLLQCTLDIGSSSATAKRIVSVCRRYMASLTVDIGFVIQAEDACELPEQMMSATRVHGVDPIKAPQL
jgi:Protein ENHANCED DISEASE RESISTANCE 2, C-terminal